MTLLSYELAELIETMTRFYERHAFEITALMLFAFAIEILVLSRPSR